MNVSYTQLIKLGLIAGIAYLAIDVLIILVFTAGVAAIAYLGFQTNGWQSVRQTLGNSERKPMPPPNQPPAIDYTPHNVQDVQLYKGEHQR